MSSKSQRPFQCHQSNSEVLHAKVSTAEKAFVRGEYKKALELANQILNEEAVQKAGSSLGIRRLQSSIQNWNVSFTSDPLDSIDCAAALSLQAYYECRPTSMNYLLPFTNCYEMNRPMPLTISLLWVQLSFAIQWSTKNAVNSTVEIFFHTGTMDRMDTEVHCDLAWTLLITMLPHSSRGSNTTELLDSLLSSSVEWSTPLSEYSYQEEINQESLKAILCTLDALSTQYKLPQEFQADVRQKITSLLTAELKSEQESQEKTLCAASPIHPVPQGIPWSQRLAKSIVHCFQGIDRRDSRQIRGQIAMVILSLYLGWKHRRRLLKGGTVVGSAVVSPLREIIDAMLPLKAVE